MDKSSAGNAIETGRQLREYVPMNLVAEWQLVTTLVKITAAGNRALKTDIRDKGERPEEEWDGVRFASALPHSYSGYES